MKSLAENDLILSPYSFPTFHQISALGKNLSSLFHSELVNTTGFTVNVWGTFNELRSFDFHVWCSLVFQMQSRQARSDPSHGVVTPNSSSVWFCCAFFFKCIFLCSFDIALTLLLELKWLTLKKHKWWFYSSRVKFLFCQYVCELIFGVIVWFESWGPKLILTNNQSRGILWILETCLTWSSPFLQRNATNFFRREEFAFEETKSTFFKSYKLSPIVHSDSYFREEQWRSCQRHVNRWH